MNTIGVEQRQENKIVNHFCGHAVAVYAVNYLHVKEERVEIEEC